MNLQYLGILLNLLITLNPKIKLLFIRFRTFLSRILPKSQALCRREKHLYVNSNESYIKYVPHEN